MSTRKRSQFVVRELHSDAELTRCLDLDHSSVTESVWQMDIREENSDLVVRLRTVRLPRPMPVAYPRDRQALSTSWTTRDCFLVAAADDVILGYVNMRIDSSRTKGWIQDLVVGAPFRRRRIGSALLDQATRWARLHQLQHITIEMQTKNYPAICFVRKQGFVFCGFNDHYYMNQDIALFFTKSV